MAYYRLYLMDGLGGHVASFVEIEAESDSAAVDKAEAHRGHAAMELWRGGKKVKRWTAGSAYTPDGRN